MLLVHSQQNPEGTQDKAFSCVYMKTFSILKSFKSNRTFEKTYFQSKLGDGMLSAS